MGSPLVTNNDIILSFNKLRGDFMVVSICLLKDESKRGSHLECEAIGCLVLHHVPWQRIHHIPNLVSKQTLCKTHIKINKICLSARNKNTGLWLL